MQGINYAIDSPPAFSRNNYVVYQDTMTLFNQGFNHIYQKES